MTTNEWTDCWKCGRSLTTADSCTGERVIRFHDDRELEPVPYGEGHGFLTYEELVSHFDERINAGQWGPLSTSELIKEREQFVTRNDPETFDVRPCRDCEAALGEIHHPGCAVEECPDCGDRYVECDCDTDEKAALDLG